MKAHCLFEQSGVFKNEFKKLGVEAYDYDIQNEFGETDFVMDLFAEINRGGFEFIEPGDVTIAFFPCTYFQANNAMFLTGRAHQLEDYSIPQKMEFFERRHERIHEHYLLICELVRIFTERGLKLVVENPATKPHYLTTYFVPATFTDNDRTIDGDYFKKPTQYWFFGFEPNNNFIFEPLEYVETLNIEWMKCGTLGQDTKTARSMIHPQYANRFIRRYIL